MFAVEPGAAGAALAELAKSLERPRAVLVISPHWEAIHRGISDHVIAMDSYAFERA